MGQCWRRIGSALAVAALVATPSVLSACVALCAPVGAAPGSGHEHAAMHHAVPVAVAEASGAAAHAGHAGSDAGTASVTERLSGANHDCCGSDGGVVLLTATSTRPDSPAATLVAPPARSLWLAPPAVAGAPSAIIRTIPPPSPPPSPLVLRI